MPADTLNVPKNRTARFKVKISQDGVVLPPPSTIPNGSDSPTIASLTRLADESGRAVFAIAGVNQGTTNCTIGSGSGALAVAVTVGPPVAGPVVFERDGDFEIS
jgi:hypothetical protein